jgi:hypothetical protein
MKTRTLLRALSLGLMIIGMTAAYATPVVSPNPLAQVKGEINYVVNITHGDHLSGFNCQYYIVVTDERGRAVAPPQQFRLGTWSYNIKEKTATMTGTRIAKIVLNTQMICPDALNFAPDSKTGTFKDGATYLFNLVPLEGSEIRGE